MMIFQVIIINIFLITAFLGTGSFILKIFGFKEESFSLKCFLSFIIGIALNSYILFILALLTGVLNKVLILVICGTGFLLFIISFKFILSNIKFKFNLVSMTGFLIVLIYFFLDFVQGLKPVVAFDALLYHFSLPTIWLNTGNYHFTSYIPWEGYPQLVEFIYCIPLSLLNDRAAQTLNVVAAFIIIMGTWGFVSKRFGKLAATIFIILFTSMTITRVAITSCGVEVFTAGFEIAIIILFILVFLEKKADLFSGILLCGLIGGVSASTKYPGFFTCINLGLSFFILSYIFKFKFNSPLKLKHWILMCFISFLVVLPFYLKNFYYTSNPFYPLFPDLFKTKYVNNITKNFGTKTLFVAGYETSIYRYLLTPISLFTNESNFLYEWNGGLLPIVVFLMPLVLFFKPLKHKYEDIVFTYFLVYGVIYFLFWLLFIPHIVRFLYPALIILMVPASISAVQLMRYSRILKILVLILVIGPCLYFQAPNRFHGMFRELDLDVILNSKSKWEYLNNTKDFLVIYNAFPAYEFLYKNTKKNDKVVFSQEARRYYSKAQYHCARASVYASFLLEQNIKEIYKKMKERKFKYAVIQDYSIYNVFLHPVWGNYEEIDKYFNLVFNKAGCRIYELKNK